MLCCHMLIAHNVELVEMDLRDVGIRVNKDVFLRYEGKHNWLLNRYKACTLLFSREECCYFLAIYGSQ